MGPSVAKGSGCPVRGQAVWERGLPSREGGWLETFPASWAVVTCVGPGPRLRGGRLPRVPARPDLKWSLPFSPAPRVEAAGVTSLEMTAGLACVRVWGHLLSLPTADPTELLLGDGASLSELEPELPNNGAPHFSFGFYVSPWGLPWGLIHGPLRGISWQGSQALSVTAALPPSPERLCRTWGESAHSPPLLVCGRR